MLYDSGTLDREGSVNDTTHRGHAAFRNVRLVLLAVVGALAAVPAAATAAVTPTPIRTNPDVHEVFPAATSAPGGLDPFLAWEQNSVRAPAHFDVVAQSRPAGSVFRVNATGTSGYWPSTVTGAQTIIYQQIKGAISDLYVYNLSSRARKKLPAKINTAAFEYHGVASTKYIAFMRLTSTARLLLLYNRSTGKVSQIATAKASCGSCLGPTWVGDQHLVYETCSSTSNACKIRVREIGGGTVTIPRAPAPYTTYGGVMDEATGDVYYISSTTWCGLFVSVSRWNIAGGAATPIYELPEGFDAGAPSLTASLTTPSDTDLLFSQYDCIADNSDIYQIESVNLI